MFSLPFHHGQSPATDHNEMEVKQYIYYTYNTDHYKNHSEKIYLILCSVQFVHFHGIRHFMIRHLIRERNISILWILETYNDVF